MGVSGVRFTPGALGAWSRQGARLFMGHAGASALFLGHELVDKTLGCAHARKPDRTRLRHCELPEWIDDDADSGSRVLPFYPRDDDEEEVGRTHRPSDLGVLHRDSVRFRTRVDLELEESLHRVDGIGANAMLRAEVDHVVRV